MKRLKKEFSRVVAIVLAMVMVLSTGGQATYAAPVAPAEGCEVCGAFVDVDTDRWYHDAIDYMVENKLMNGVNDTQFAPNETLNRAMFVTILYRMSGAEAVDAEIAFDDVEEGRYYTEAIQWAAANKIVEGYGNGKFGTEDAVTREQMATILYRYAGAEAVETEMNFDDADEISAFAQEAMQWAVAEGLMEGYKNKLEPADTATRAEAAQVLIRFLDMEAEPEVKAPGKDSVESIQAVIKPHFYGYKLAEVNIQYADNTDLSAVEASDYTLWDRGYSAPNFVEAQIVEAQVDDDADTVKLVITQDTEATAARKKNPVGVMATGSWYIDNNGVIYAGKADSTDAVSGEAYKANTTGKGYQTRKELDLVLAHGDEGFAAGLALTDGKGNYTDANKWLASVNESYAQFEDVYVDVDPFMTEYLGEAYDAPGYEAFEGKVPVKVALPENYDANRAEGYPLVVYITGGGTSYWELYDEAGKVVANNYGTNVSFDYAITAWTSKDVIAITPHVHSGNAVLGAQETAAVIDYFVNNYNVDADRIIQNGNSFGTQITSEVIRQFPGLVDVFVSNNGRLGVGVAAGEDANGHWTTAEVESMAKNGTAFWLFNGETDSAHPQVSQDVYKKMVKVYQEAGWSDEWIADNLRVSGYQSWKFKYWGETDHSCTKVTYWYYFDQPYTNIWEGKEDLKAGDTYTLTGKEDYNYVDAAKFEYKVYAESVSEWALSRNVEKARELQPGNGTVESIQAYTDMSFYGQKLDKVVIQYDAGTDLSEVGVDTYTLWDRGYSSPMYVEAEIVDVIVDDKADVVTLVITKDTEKITDRSKNPVGLMATASWYIDIHGEIYYGKEVSQDPISGDFYLPNNTRKGYQTRNLDLVLAHGDDSFAEGLAMSDGRGNYTDAGKWLEPVNAVYDEFEDMYIDVDAYVSEVIGEEFDAPNYEFFDGKVPTKVHFPENYDVKRAEKYPLAVYITGSGTSYWELYDAAGKPLAHNFGTNLTFDNAGGAWLDKDVIMITPHVHSNNNEVAARELAAVIDYFVENYNADPDHVIANGNSNGTQIISENIRQFPGLVDVFVSNNGRLGKGVSAGQDSTGHWTMEEVKSMAENGTAFWLINGETDSAHPQVAQDVYKKMVAIYEEAGWSDEWIAENIRISAYQSWKFKYWGETDHSCTKMTYWYYFDNVYQDVYEGAGALKYGDTYKLTGAENYNYANAAEFEYKVYSESVGEWALGFEKSFAERSVIPSNDTVVSIQAITEMAFYGQKLSKVEIQYAAGADLSGVGIDTYTLWDRGYSKPNYVEAEIVDVIVDDEADKVTLVITNDTEATGTRSKNPVGVYGTGSWYMDVNGVIYSGKAESTDALSGDVYQPNTTGKGYQTRQNLDLVLDHGDDFADGLAMTDGKGNYTAEDKWLESIDTPYDEFEDMYIDVDAFVSEFLGEAYDAAGYENFDGKVPVKVHFPENYDANRAEGYPLAVYATGAGTSYWELYDAEGNVVAHNYGTNLSFDNAAASWMNEDIITITPHVHSTGNTVAAQEVAGVIDYFVKNYNIDEDVIILNGNSNGTVISSEVLRQFPGLADVFVCNNGRLGDRPAGSGEAYATGDVFALWTTEEVNSLAENGVAFWLINGETDSSHPLICQNEYVRLVDIYSAAGWSDEWIADNLRISAYQSWKFKYWGETDHSCTKMTYWYYADNAYLDVWEGEADLQPGDTYTLAGKENFGYYGAENYEYTVYAEGVNEWALNRDNKGLAEGVVDVQAVTAPGPFGQKLAKVIITYAADVDASALDLDSFELRAEKNNLTGEYATSTITAVYAEGNQVIIETDAYDKVGLVVDNYYYTVDGATKSLAVRKDLYNAYNISVLQKDEVVGKDGAVIAPAGEKAIAIDQADIEFPVLNEFEHITLTDEEANEVLADVVFGNDNFEYSISSNTTKGNHIGLTEDDLLGDLNDATLAGLGVHVWIHLPDNYDPAQEYPLFVFAHGTGETISSVTLEDGTVLDNQGVHYALNLAPSTWAVSEDLGYEDVIVIAPQYYSGNSPREDGYERDDAMRAAFFYTLQNYSVNEEKVYVSGTSQGAGRTTALLRDCAEYITAVIVQNGGYSSAVSRLENGVDIHEAVFKYAAENNVAAWWFQGINDFISPVYVAETMRQAMENLYKEAGKTDEWLQDNLRITLFHKQLYTDMNESSAHSSIKPTYEWYAIYDHDRYYGKYNEEILGADLDQLYGENDPNGYKGMMDWALSKTKSALSEEPIVEIKAETAPSPFGEKLSKVYITYAGEVDASALDLDSFELRAQTNNLTGEYETSTITSVTVEGNTVIIETDNYDKAGLLVGNYYYQDGDAVKSFTLRKDLYDAYKISVAQLDDVVAADGSVVAYANDRGYAIENIEISVADDFQYLYLNDEEANEVLADVVFGNDNFEYSISSNTTKGNHIGLTEDDLLGDLNEATLSGLGVHLWYHLPDNYDPAKEYPLFVYAHGTGETLSSVTLADGTVLGNEGVHYAVNLAASVWAESEDLGYEDVIVIAPQYYSGNSPREDGYERDDAMRAAFFYTLKNFAVNKEKVYVSGTSQGAGRTTALLRDCAEYITAVIVQNGGYSSAVSRLENGVDIHEAVFEYAAANNVAAWWFQGINDFISPVYVAETMRQAMENLYKEAGKSDEWLQDNLRITLFHKQLYTDMNESSAHSSIKPTYEWYAIYDHDRYYGMYNEDILGADLDQLYGENDPNGYEGMMDWALSKTKSALSEEEVVEKLTPDKIPATDPAKGIQSPIKGYYEIDVTVGNEIRTAKVYIPVNAKYGDYSVFLNVPAGENTTRFLQDTGWMDLADEENFFLFAVETENEQWTDDDAAYISAAFASLKSNTYFRPHSSAFYVVGYGEGGRLMQEFAMVNTLSVAAAAYIDASDIDAETLAEIGAKKADTKTDVTVAEIPTPVWIFSSETNDNVKGVIKYWKAANACSTRMVNFALDSVAYPQNGKLEYTADEAISKVVVHDGSVDITDPALAETIYNEFLCKYDSYGSVATGWMDGDRPDYDELGVERVIFDLEYDGAVYEREYMMYIPEAVQNGNAKVPVVFVAPGAGSSDSFMFDTSMWWKVADANDFIVVIVTAVPGNAGSKIGSIGWNTNGDRDLLYLDEVVAQLSANKLVDTTRLYFSGQSQGCVFANHVAMNRSDVFAAVGATSGPMLGKLVEEEQQQMPFLLMLGEFDNDKWDYTVAGKPRTNLSYWIDINGTVDIDNPSVVDEENGRYLTSIWNNSQGYPMVQYTKTGGRGHSTIADEGNVLWAYLSQWQRTEDGLFYQDQQVSMVEAQAVTDYGFYGQKLFQVVLTYEEEVDPASVGVDTYTVKDYPSNFANGEKLAAVIESVEVNGNQVIINIADAPEANPVGTMVATNWVINPAGEAVSKGNAYWHRDDVDTEVYHNAAVKAVDGSVLAPASDVAVTMTVATQHNKFDQLKNLGDLQIEVPQANLDYMQGNYYVPADQSGDVKYPMVILMPGGGTTYKTFEIDGVTYNNAATAATMDRGVVAWLDAPEEMIIIAASSSNSKNVIATIEYFIENMNADPDRVYLIGNSAGCTQSAGVMKERPDLIAAYNPNNGGFTWNTWSEEQIDAMMESPVAVFWAAGETDSNKPRDNQNQYLMLVEAYANAGISEEWIAENVRIYGYPHVKFEPWGVTDHSATKMTYYYYFDQPYTNPTSSVVAEGEELEAGATFTMAGIPSGSSVGAVDNETNYAGQKYVDFEYTIYEDDVTIMNWMLSQVKGSAEADRIQAQAVTDYGFYGQKLFQVILTYGEEVDPASVGVDTYTVKDYPSNFANGEKLAAVIESVEVDGNQVIINIADAPEKNPVGTMVATNWVINPAGEAVSKGNAYWHRDDVDTEVYHNAAVKAVDGSVLADASSKVVNMTEETQHNKFDQFQNLGDLQIEVPQANLDYMQGNYYVPADQSGDVKYPMVILMPGGGTTYKTFEIDGVTYNNAATAATMDRGVVAWLDAPEEMIIIAASSSNSKNVIATIEYFIENMNADPDRVYLIGNSAGCTQSAGVMKERPDLIAAYNPNNGGFTWNTWSAEQIAAMMASPVAVFWAAGETDSNKPRDNQNQYLMLVEAYAAAGMDAEWIEENIRIYGYPHVKFEPWGVTDHSATKMTYYYYFDQPYTNPTSSVVAEGEELEAGATFTMAGIPSGSSVGAVDNDTNYAGQKYVDFEYTIYGEDVTIMDWMLSQVKIRDFVPKLNALSIPDTDPAKGIQSPIKGYYEVDVKVGSEVRTAKVYIPVTAKYGDYSVFINVPAGEDTTTFLKESGWMDLADEEQFFLFAAETENEEWSDDDAAYITAAFNSLKSNTYFRPHSSAFYVVGYGEGGRLMQEFAMANTLSVAAAAYIDASDIDAETLAEIGAKKADNKTDVTVAEVPTPVWIFSSKTNDNVKGVIKYWKAANACSTRMENFALDSVAYPQNGKLEYTAGEAISKVVVRDGAVDIKDPAVAATIYNEFLRNYDSYGSVATGWMVGERPDYEALGVETVVFEQEFEDKTYEREYMLYIPEAVQNGNAKVPVVLVAPGSGSSDSFMFDTSMWWKVADANNFIVASLTAVPGNSGRSIGSIGWNTSGERDLLYVDAVVEQLSANKFVDTTRLYFSGQSQGSGFTNHVATNRSDVFAAVAATSGPIMATLVEDEQDHIPYYLLIGEYDMDNWDYTKAGKVRTNLSYWIDINATVGIDEPSVVDEVNGRYETSSWNNEQGYPLVQFTKTHDRGHSTVADEGNMMWDYLQNWSRTEDGLFYNDQLVTYPEPEAVVSAQAVTDYGFYGQKLFQVILTYDQEVDPASVNENTYIVKDYPSNFANGEKLAAPIESVEVDGNQVIINIADAPEANPVGTLVATNWVINPAGEAVAKGNAYWHIGDVNTEVYHSAPVKALDGSVIVKTTKVAVTMTEETQHNKYDQFKDLGELQIEVPQANLDYMQGSYYVPETDDEEALFPMVISMPGGGTTYKTFEIDGVTYNNAHTAVAMDKSDVAWLDAPEDVIIIAASSSNSANVIETIEYFIENFQADPDRVYLIGNSAGCGQSAGVIMNRPDLIAAYNNNNGGFTWNSDTNWTDEQRAGLMESPVAVFWAAGETDSNKPRDNQNQYLMLVEAYKEAGISDEWIAENLRIYGYPHEKFAVWGVTDHSATKMTYYYFFDQHYNNPTSYYGEEGEALEVGATFTMSDIPGGNSVGAVDANTNYAGQPYGEFEYTIYEEDVNMMDWLLGQVKGNVEYATPAVEPAA